MLLIDNIDNIIDNICHFQRFERPYRADFRGEQDNREVKRIIATSVRINLALILQINS